MLLRPACCFALAHDVVCEILRISLRSHLTSVPLVGSLPGYLSYLYCQHRAFGRANGQNSLIQGLERRNTCAWTPTNGDNTLNSYQDLVLCSDPKVAVTTDEWTSKALRMSSLLSRQ
ncbi:hypothetical protein GGR56DRAFT_652766 [Xylariaceae sp. FL0804]|nr:hypothetical protein GGR56DRAFT_652766 [Xylariaceae sp. FL0804]